MFLCATSKSVLIRRSWMMNPINFSRCKITIRSIGILLLLNYILSNWTLVGYKMSTCLTSIMDHPTQKVNLKISLSSVSLSHSVSYSSKKGPSQVAFLFDLLSLSKFWCIWRKIKLVIIRKRERSGTIKLRGPGWTYGRCFSRPAHLYRSFNPDLESFRTEST